MIGRFNSNDMNLFEIDNIFNSDLEKFKRLFDDIGIKYRVANNMPYPFDNLVRMSVNPKEIQQNYGNAISIYFTKDGKYSNFEAYGD